MTTADVMFWINMLKDPKVGPIDYGVYNGFPDAFVSSIRVVSPTKLQDDHEEGVFARLVPVQQPEPDHADAAGWDRTASGPSACATKITDCTAVYRYLDAQSRQSATYASSPIWSIVDGPWKLSAFNADGHATFVPNARYSGPVKPTLSKFEEVPLNSEAAEYRALRSPPASGRKIDVGYLPLADAPAKPTGSGLMSPGTNPLPGYTLRPLYIWGINYFVMNFQSSTGNGPVIRQLYFRQALAHLLNQEAVINGPLHGYGTPTVGPVGNTPVTQFLSPLLKSGDPFPFDPAKARSLLTSHGWKVVKGVTTCVAPARCGPGINSGHRLVFNLNYVTGTSWIAQEMKQLQSNALLAGIRINLQPESFGQIAALAVGNCKVAKLPCNWDMANWGSGWLFGPDFAPTGETLFKCGAIANSGGYCAPLNDALINKTLTNYILYSCTSGRTF